MKSFCCSASSLRQFLALSVAVCLLVGLAVGLAADPQDKPFSLFGTVTLDGAALPSTLPVTAVIAGVELATDATFEDVEGSSYRLDVPGDILDTATVEGGQEGQTITLRFGASEAPVQATWTLGAVERLDVALTSGPDLGVALVADAASVQPGETLGYELTVSNGSTLTSLSVMLRLVLPPGVTVASVDDDGTEAALGEITWPAFDLPAGASFITHAEVVLAASFPADAEVVSAQAQVTGDGADGLDPDPANNLASVETTLDASPDLVLTLDDGRDLVAPGETLTYTLTIQNTGDQDASAVLLSALLPGDVTFLTATGDGIESPPGTITWPAFDLAVGATASRQLTWRFDGLDAATELVATASVEPGNGPDANPADNQASDIDTIEQVVDLEASAMDTSLLITDPATASLSGSVAVTVRNLGNGLASDPFALTLFEDLDGDGVLSAVDQVLGLDTFTPSLGGGDSQSFEVTVSGQLLFLGNRLYAWVDSAEAVAESDESNNIVHSAEACLAPPVVGDFQPVLELSWPDDVANVPEPLSKESLSTPIVVQLSDDNGDGVIDDRDVPDIVFVSANLVNPLDPKILLRAISGDDGHSLFAVTPPASQFLTFALSGLAAGDLDGNGTIEIIVSTPSPPLPPFGGFSNHLSAYNRLGQRLWSSDAFVTHPTGTTFTNRDHPTLADLDGDGLSEILVGANVFNHLGQLQWTGSGGQAYQSARNADGVDSGAISVAADLDLDGMQEVVTGNTVYRADGTVMWQTGDADGYPAVANFDADDFPEIVVVARGQVRLHDQDGTLIWGPIDLPGTGAEAGGAPTVADFDGDGEPEIGVAGSTQYAVFETDGTIKWQRTVQDGSSNQTGSTVFDLDGDGRYEVIYRDETHLRIYRGDDGTVLFEHAVSSFTANEQPVVADVDGDGRAEIIVSSDLASSLGGIPTRTSGILVFGDGNDNWVGTRGLWNQSAFSYDNVNDDGTIPTQPERSWLSHNTFRANLPPAEGAFAASNLTASRLTVDFADYPTLTLSVRVGNGGLTTAPAGVPLAFYDGAPETGGQLIGVVVTESALAPGQFTQIQVPGTSSGFGPAQVVAIVGDDGAGGGQRRECVLDDNRQTLDYTTDPVGLIVQIDDGTDSLRPEDIATYQVTASNGSQFDRSGVAVSVTVPPFTSVVAVSDGGNLNGDVVTWPAVPLTAGASIGRSVTLAVAADLPLTQETVDVTVSVADDGSHGDDPSPSNNVAVDSNRVLTVRADAGGPYTGDEGATLIFDASGSSDRDGSVVAYAWDLDNDGLFDDGDAITASRTFDDNGTHTVAVRVTDDSGETDIATATVTVNNVAPVVDAGTDLQVTEGDAVTLAGASFSDAGSADTHTATVDWGNGTLASATVNQATGVLSAGHSYPDDGTFVVTVGVTDDDGAQTCDSFTVTVENSDPVLVAGNANINFYDWVAEGRAASPGDWRVENGGSQVRQRENSNVVVLYSPLVATGLTFRGTVQVNTSRDDDFFGFVLGFQPGDFQNPEAEYLVVDWKQSDEINASMAFGARGLAISRAYGFPYFSEFWSHLDLPGNGPSRVEELQRGQRFGDIGWRDRAIYTFTIETTPQRVRVFVDDILELDLSGDFDFGPGRFGLYGLSQENVIYSGFSTEGNSAVEGSEATFRLPFNDVGVLDTHTATVDWQDGTVGAGLVEANNGSGTVSGTHIYAEDGDHLVHVCVEDDDQGEACGEVALQILNAAPTVEAGDDRLAYSATGLDVLATFSDPGVLDLHSATVDWGDGTVTTETVDEAAGQGTVAAAHHYDNEGTYTVVVCVEDDDGASGCDRFDVTWLDPRLDLMVAGLSDRQVVRPGESFSLGAAVRNVGTLDTSGVVLTMQVPSYLNFVSAADGGVYDDASRTVTWGLAALPRDMTLQRFATLQADASLPFGTEVDALLTVQDDGSQGADLTPLNNQVTVPLVLWNSTSPAVQLSLSSLEAEGEVVEGSLITLSAQLHAGAAPLLPDASIEWGDGNVESSAWTATTDGGELTTQHTFVDDGSYRLEVCVSDSNAVEGCSHLDIEVGNLPATLFSDVGLDLTRWQVEAYPTVSTGGEVLPEWAILAGGAEAVQLLNATPSLLYGDLTSFGNTLEGTLRVDPACGDDDFIGFALGFEPGDSTNPEADYVVVDWKKANQGTTGYGLKAYRVLGVPDREDFWTRDSTNSSTPGRVAPIANGLTLGNVGWNFDQSYHVRFEQSASQLQVWVDDVLEINTIRPFEDGLFAFFNHSQGCVHYSGFRASRAEIDEGSPLDIDMTFRDPGILDSHSGTLQWGDGTIDEAVLDAVDGAGTVFGSHVYPEDGEHILTICLDDNGGARGCNTLPVTVHNVAPTVQGNADLSVHRGLATVLDLATFTDPGALDTHTATIDWGDGTTDDGTVISDNGTGSVQGSHAYAVPGTYTVEVCVTDDDGDTGCGQTTIDVGAGPPVLDVSKIDLLLDDVNGDGLAGRGDLVGYQLTVQNNGESDAFEVMLSDVLPSWVTLVPGTLATGQGTVVSTDPIVIDLGTIVPGSSGGAAVTIEFVVELGDAIPFELEFLSNQAEVTQQLNLPPVRSDDPDTPELGDATLTALAPSDATTVCEVDSFDGPLFGDPEGDEWTFTYLGDGNDGQAEVIGGRLRLTGNGSSLFHDGDHGSFLYRELSGNDDFRVEVEVTGFPLDQGGDVRKTALMLRSGTGAYDPRVMVTFVPHFPDPSGTGVQFDFRALVGDPGAEVANTVFAVPLPARLAIEKRGDRYTLLFSTDGGATWTIPTGVPHQGTVEVDLGPTILAGMAVSSYDTQTLFGVELDDFAVCRPNDGPPVTPVDIPCDPNQPVDLVYLLDISGSMTADFPDGAAMLSRLEAAQLAISEIHGQLTADGDGSRAALVTFAGFRTPQENLSSGAVVVSGLTDDLPAVADLVDALQVADIQSGDTSPLAIALATARQLLQTEADETHQQAIVLLTDGIPNIDAAGRGPDGYELDELQALSLDDGRGRFRPWSDVAWSGGFNGLLGTFDGEPLANVMAEMERAKQALPTLRIYGLGLEGDGFDLGTFNGDLLEYGAHVTGARAFSVGDTATLLAATDALWANLRCEDLGSGVLGDRVWYDVDGDGNESPEEPGLGDVTVQLYDGHGFRLPFTTTGAAGAYTFDQLTAGTYVVEVHPGSLPANIMTPTFDADSVATMDWVAVTLADGETNLGIDFGYSTDDDGPHVNLCAVDTFDQAPVDPSWTLTTLGDADVAGMEITGSGLQLTGNGSSLFNLDDNAAFAYQAVTGDVRVEVEITGFPVDQGGQVRKACLMLRGDLAVRGPRAMACFIPHLQGDGGLTTGLQFHYREEAGVTDDWANLLQHIPLPMRFAIERQGDHLTVEYSRDHGATWVQPTGGAQGEVDIVLPQEVLVGPAVVSYDPATPVTAAFDDFAVCPVDGGQAP